MAYNNIVDRTGATALIPEEYARDIIEHIPDESAALSMFRHVPMSRGQLRMPAESALAMAYFVNGDTGIKQTTEAQWANLYLNAEELAAIVPIPEPVLDDVAYDIWGLIRPQLTEALARALDAAVFFGTNKPASWPSAIIAEATTVGATVTEGANAAAAGGIVGDFSDVFGKVEAFGYDVNGIVANRTIKGKLRQARATTGEQLSNPEPSGPAGSTPDSVVYSVPINYPMRGLWPAPATGAAEAVVGDFSQGLLGIRQDLTWKILDQAVIMDNSAPPQVIYNLAQQDMVAMRVVARFAFQVANRLTYEQPTAASRYPFGVLLHA
jgi:HK97 family phage major capsid protein